MVDFLICLAIGICVALAVAHIIKIKVNAKKTGSAGCIGCSVDKGCCCKK